MIEMRVFFRYKRDVFFSIFQAPESLGGFVLNIPFFRSFFLYQKTRARPNGINEAAKMWMDEETREK